MMRANMINNQKLDAIFNHVDDYAIFTLDEAGKVSSWNKASAEVLKIDDNEVLGRSYAELVGIGSEKIQRY